jgi:hypothetical protein
MLLVVYGKFVAVRRAAASHSRIKTHLGRIRRIGF